MTASSAISSPLSLVPTWHMPVVLENYPDHSPMLTSEEKKLMERYILTPIGALSNVSTSLLTQLERFNQPFLDTVRLTNHTRQKVAPARRLLFEHMMQTGMAFWAWPKDIWIEVIEAYPSGHTGGGIRFWMLNLAYLFGGFLHVAASTNYNLMADAIFGKTLVDAQVDTLFAPLRESGYSNEKSAHYRFRWMTALTLLMNRHPEASALSAPIIAMVNTVLTSLPQPQTLRGQQKRRNPLLLLQVSLCQLGILDEPVILETKAPTNYGTGWENDSSIDPLWGAWIRAYYEQTPHLNERTIRHHCYDLLTAGRWLKKQHPGVCEPDQWTEALANEYVTYTCNRAIRGEHANPSYGKYAHFQDAAQKLSPSAISSRLQAMRSLFAHLQRRAYTVQGQLRSKLQLTWVANEAFKMPEDVRAAIQPNPKDIQEDIWFKLIWAACTLTKDKLYAFKRGPKYPLAYFRAACLVWVAAARRSDEIRRLSVGCVSREWAPEMYDEKGQRLEPAEELCYLRIPTNKMKGDFYVPVPAYVADAIEVWESVRPPNQAAREDRKTRKPTKYLFQYRNELMGQNFLNKHAIPLLCKLAGVSETDIVGRITSHRARATTATWMRKMGMAPADIGKLLGHTNPARSLPWYLREDKHHLGRAYRKANPLERYVAAILDTNAHAKQEPCVFYYLADGPGGRPRMCGNPHFSRCIHQMMCIECEAFIDHELAEAIEKREGAIVISVPIPLPVQMVAELNEQDEEGLDATMKLETLLPPALPGPAFHFNKKVPLRSAANEAVDLQTRLAQVEGQIAKKQGKTDRRSASLQALLKERAELQAHIEAQEKGSQ
jgi:integrase